MRPAIAAILAAGLLALALVSEPASFAIALLAMLLAFLLAGSKLALDLVELSPLELGADVAASAALGFALTRVTTGNVMLVSSLLLVALAAQVAPRAVRMARCRRRSGPSSSTTTRR